MSTTLKRSLWGYPWTAITPFFDNSFDPARARRHPLLNEFGESNVQGLYLAGEIAGAPLIKLGLNRGRAVVDHIINLNSLLDLAHGSDSCSAGSDAWLDILIIGAGSAGLGAADRCQQSGVKYLVIEAQRTAQLIRNFTTGKLLFMEPLGQQNETRFFCQECTKEELLEQWDRQIIDLGIAPFIHQFEPVQNIHRYGDKDGFRVQTDKAVYMARRVILAIGTSGYPRRLHVKGEFEQEDRISQNLTDPADWQSEQLLVFGAGDVACEAAVALAEAGNRVSLAAPDKKFIFPKQRNIDAVLDQVHQGNINLYLNHAALSVGPSSATIKNLGNGEQLEIPATHIFRCIGTDLPFQFFKKIGIRLEGSWNLNRVLLLICTFVVCYFIYGAKTDPPLWPFNLPSGLFTASGKPTTFAYWWQTLGVGSGNWSFKLNGSFWYSFAYCLVMTIFGVKAYYRWGILYNDSYQKKRYTTLIIAQWTLAFLIPNIVMWGIHGLWPDNSVLGYRDNWWHASGFEYAFPLFFWQFFWDVGWLYLIYGLAATLIVIPILTIRHGKRYCTWLCGCGGLAETLGDPWRHLAPKGQLSKRWEWMNGAVLIWSVTAAVLVAFKVGLGYWITGQAFVTPEADQHGSLTAWAFRGYQLIADVWLVGIIPGALYPIYGGKIWCRYWCPLAKWMEMTSRWFGTLQISSNEKCISCGECSRYCEVGIDVMAFAKNQESFHNDNSSCIQCGICITVCPMDVLSFDNKRRGILTERLVQISLVTPRKISLPSSL